MAGFVAASLLESQAACRGRRRRRSLIAVLIGVVNGIGVGVFRVHPLIMTLGMGLVIFGASNAWQLLTVRTASGVPPEIIWLGSATVVQHRAGTACSCSCRSRSLILVGLRRTGYGRLLYAIGDNPIAARLSAHAHGRCWSCST